MLKEIFSSMLIPGIWVFLIYAVFFLYVRHIGKKTRDAEIQGKDDRLVAVNIIKERLAKGEISEKEYSKLKKEILEAGR